MAKGVSYERRSLSCILQVDPENVRERGWGSLETETQTETCDCRAETAVMRLPAWEAGKAREDPALEPAEGAWPCQHLAFRCCPPD